MILRPVSPASPTGPPITNLPVGLTRKLRPWSSSSFFSSYSSAGRIGGHPGYHSAGDIELVVVGRVGARLVGLVDALGDVRRLLVDCGDDGAALAVEPVLAARVADLPDRLARDLRDIHVALGGD